MSAFPATWRILPLELCLDALIDYRGKTPKKSAYGIPLLSAKVIKGGRILDDIFEFIPTENYDTWMRRGLPSPGDVVMTTEGPLGEIAQLDGRKYALGQRIVTLRGKKDVLDNNFLKFMMQSEFIQQQLLARATGTTVLGIKQRELRQVEMLLPPLDEQRAIAHILGSLDDKIEANRRLNETLEATARAIFKSWFVDFDPVHTKARGEHPPGMDAATAALFPDSFKESALGPIPRGWGVVSIGDHVKAVKGLSYKGDFLADSADDGVPLHNLNSISSKGGYQYSGIKFYAGDYKPRHEVRPGDLIVANTDLTLDLLVIASPAIIPPVFGDKGIISHHVYKVEIKRGSPLTRLFLYYRIMMRPFRDLLQGYTNGTTVNMLPSDAFERPLFVIPPAELMQRFDALVEPMLDQIEHIYLESRTLAETRDALLPRLVSGEIRTPILE